MLSLKQKQSGFTIVELLIVIVIIGILAGLVITTFVGIQARARDSERQTDINAIQKQVEAYYANNGSYPSAADLADTTFRSGNNIKLDAKAIADPSNSTATSFTTTGVPTATTSPKMYFYVTTPTSCGSATTAAGAANTPAGGVCTTYTLSAWLEAGNKVYSQSNQ